MGTAGAEVASTTTIEYSLRPGSFPTVTQGATYYIMTIPISQRRKQAQRCLAIDTQFKNYEYRKNDD